MRRRPFRSLTGCIALVIAIPGSGLTQEEDRPADPLVLPAIEATVRWRPGDESLTRSVSEVQFDGAPVPWRDLGEWLSSVSGSSTRGSALAGGEFISVRGSRPEGVLVLLDGHPLNDPMTGRADLSTVPIGTLSSATLVRGASSARYGTGAMAGVLLLSSREARASEATGALRVSSFGGLGGEVQVAGSGTAGRASLSISADHAENDFSFENRLVPGSPVETRTNTDGSRFSIASSASRGRTRLGFRYDAVERGSPGPMGNRLFDRARWKEGRAVASLGWEGSRIGISGRFGWSTSDWDMGTGGGQTTTRDARILGAGVETRTGGPERLELAGRFSLESLEGDDLSGEVRRLMIGGSAARSFSVESFLVRPAISIDGTAEGAAVSPEIGLRVPVGSRIALRARAGQAFRMPTLADLNFSPGLRVRSNPDLEPERVILDAEMGLEGSSDAGGYELSGGISGWYRQTEDPIVWLASAAALWTPRNLDRLVSYGVEGSVEVSTQRTRSAGWGLSAAATLDHSRLGFGSNQNPVPYRPGTAATLGLQRWSTRLSIRAWVRWTGSRTTTVAGTRSLPGFATADFAVAWKPPLGIAGFEVEGRVDNLLDRYYELVELHPEPGRRLSLTVRYR
ncbi:MAG: TonB-dependent receptor [marine benthic group bacterium]|nr:TonB-dependent receptor [Gemmatimonadota bacterium]